MSFEFATAARIVFGAGKVREIGGIAAGLGKRALVVTGRRVERARALVGLLDEQGLAARVYPVAGEPELDTVAEGVAFARDAGCDVVIGFGGGSAIDAGKAIAAMLANPGEVTDYIEIIGKGAGLVNAPVPYIAVPTTAGTGAEATRNAVLGSKKDGVKASLRSPLMLPRVALVDPELALSLPPRETAETGLDALTQLLEAFVCTRANPMTDALCEKGIGLAARSLEMAFADGGNLAARIDMALAALLSGIALANAGLGAVHGFAAPIGGMFAAPHGAVCAALLPHVWEANLRAVEERGGVERRSRFARAARLLTGDEAATSQDALPWLRGACARMSIRPLREFGISGADADGIVDRAMRASSMKANPVELSREELRHVLAAAN